MNKENPKRYTVGILTGFQIYEGSSPNPFVAPVVRGMQSAARDQGINIMVACGMGDRLTGNLRYRPAWPTVTEENDFVPIGPWNTDGLMVLAPLRSDTRSKYLLELKERGFPVLYVGTGAGTPTVMVDNKGGIRLVMDHLVEHGYREIAMIAGDEEDPGDSLIRLTAYRQSVKDGQLADDPRLIEYGQHWEVGGYKAMQRMLQSGVQFSAVVCSNDESAIGVMRALREAGKRIPWDVAVTGFDDHLVALAQIPPLTSVHYPLFETGYRSLLLMRKWLEQGPQALQDEIRVSTWLVPRQSCGCLPESVASAVIKDNATFDADKLDPQAYREDLSQAMMGALLAETTPSNIREIRPLCDRMVEAFMQSMQDGDLSHFQIALIEILQRVEMMDDDAHAWQSAISVLRVGAHTIFSDNLGSRREERAEDLLHQARTLLSESARRRYTRLQLQQTYYDEAMGRLTARLLSSLNEEQILTTLREHLPRVGIRQSHLAFFEPRGEDPVAWSRLYSYEKDATPIRFESRQFPPPGLYPAEEPFNLALLPLFFQDETLGYVAFDGGNLDPLAQLVRQLSSAIKSAELHKKILELSLTDSLTEVSNRRYFEILLQKEVERSKRYNRDLAVIMIDIDHFKKYNDAFGHPAGDEALREIAQCIVRGARRGLDVVSRYGGEEFAIILPETNTEGAGTVAENIRRQVIVCQTLLRPTTISLGIASLCGNQLRSQALVDQADRALYQAKNQGRNRVVKFEEWMIEAAHTPPAENILPTAIAPQEGD